MFTKGGCVNNTTFGRLKIAEDFASGARGFARVMTGFIDYTLCETSSNLTSSISPNITKEDVVFTSGKSV